MGWTKVTSCDVQKMGDERWHLQLRQNQYAGGHGDSYVAAFITVELETMARPLTQGRWKYGSSQPV